METKTQTTYTAEQCRRDFTPKLKRAQVLEIGRKFGFSAHLMRQLIEGPEATIKREVYAGQARGYFNLEDVLRQLRQAP